MATWKEKAAEYKAKFKAMGLWPFDPSYELSQEEVARIMVLTEPASMAEKCSGGDWHRVGHVQYLSSRLQQAVAGRRGRVIISAPRRHGKALALDTPIPTPLGWTTMGELRIGDEVFAADGSICCIVGKSEVLHDRECFKVETSDGYSVVADGEHLWPAQLDHRWRGKLYTTRALAKPRGLLARAPVAAPLQLPTRSLPIDPYVLGYWLGDGRTSAAHITVHPNDHEVVEYLGAMPKRWMTVLVLGLQKSLRVAGLLGNKHVPPDYLRASVEQRRLLLSGLMDSDGYASAQGQHEFCTTSPRLALDARELIVSLGYKVSLSVGRATLYGKDCGPKYRLLFYGTGVFKLKRKKAREREPPRPFRSLWATKTESVPVQCIQVDSADGLFLCSEGMIPTHNSEMASHWLPAWYLCVEPKGRVILASYGAEFATEWGRKVRDTLLEWAPILEPRAVPRDDVKAADSWKNQVGGGMTCVGVSGPMMGRGATLLIVDDPIETWVQATSQTWKDRMWDWWRSTALTSLEPGATVVVIMTRYAEDDLIGRIERDSKPGSWQNIKFPALAEENDILGRAPGTALWPARVSAAELNEVKDNVGRAVWAGMYQQRPAPEEGAMLRKEWWRHYPHTDAEKIAGEADQLIQSWDLAFKKSDSSDYVVGQVWARRGRNFYLLDQVRRRMDFPDTVSALRAMSMKHPRAVVKLIEESANGFAVIQTLRHELPGIIPISTKGRSKVVRLSDPLSRAHSVAAMVESGRVWLPEGLAFSQELISEAAAFPYGEHDDQVDALSQALSYMAPASWGRQETHTTEPSSPEEAARAAFWQRMRDQYYPKADDEDRRPERYKYLNS